MAEARHERAAYFTLHFTGGDCRELERTVFFHPLVGDERVAVRGKTAGVWVGAGTFQWSPAVRALAALIVRLKAWSLSQGSVAQPVLSGEGASPAASLDYALAKQPLWLSDMFGVDSRGRTLAARVFQRSNPERRHPGPVVLTVNPRFLPLSAVRVHVERQEVSTAEELQGLAGNIERQAGSMRRARRTLPACAPAEPAPLELRKPWHALPAPFDRPDEYEYLRAAYHTEILSRLRALDVFTAGRAEQLLKSIYDSRPFRKIAGRCDGLLSDLDRSLNSSGRLGLVDETALIARYFKGDEPLRVAASSLQASSLAIFTCLRHVRGCRIEIDFRHPHSTELVTRGLEGRWHEPPDALVVSCAGAVHLLKSTGDYRPLMILPGITHRVVGPSSLTSTERTMAAGEYEFMFQIPTMALFYFEALAAAGAIKRNAVRLIEAEPCDTTASFKDASSTRRAILPFPHFALGTRYHRCLELDKATRAVAENVAVLVVHERLLRQEERCRLLDVLVRDAWLSLAEGGSCFEQTLDAVLHDPSYLNFIKRTCGLHAYGWDEAIAPPARAAG